MADKGSNDILYKALENITEEDFRIFKDKLLNIKLKGRRNIPQKALEKADKLETKNILVKFFGSDKAIDVTIRVFKKVSLMDSATKLKDEREQVNWMSASQKIRKPGLMQLSTLRLDNDDESEEEPEHTHYNDDEEDEESEDELEEPKPTLDNDDEEDEESEDEP